MFSLGDGGLDDDASAAGGCCLAADRCLRSGRADGEGKQTNRLFAMPYTKTDLSAILTLLMTSARKKSAKTGSGQTQSKSTQRIRPFSPSSSSPSRSGPSRTSERWTWRSSASGCARWSSSDILSRRRRTTSRRPRRRCAPCCRCARHELTIR
eukprot:COSAG06_NODE_10300_length_1707_cov_2.571517_2_plen_153_part_00